MACLPNFAHYGIVIFRIFRLGQSPEPWPKPGGIWFGR